MFAVVALLLVGAPPHFRAAPGWQVGSHGSWGWASTVRFRDCGDCVPPHRTLTQLRPDGILVQLGNFRAERPPQASPDKWPPRIRRKDLISGGGEGIPRQVSFGEWFIRRAGVEHFLWAWFGRRHPTRRQLARANAELRTAR